MGKRLFGNSGIGIYFVIGILFGFWVLGFGFTPKAFAVQLGGGGTAYPEKITGSLEVTAATTFNGVYYTWPSLQGGASTFLQNNGSGTLSWASAGVGSVTYVDSGTGLTGGPITSVGTLELANTAVTPGTYEATWGSPTLVIPGFTVDQQGRLTNATTFTFTLPVLPSGTEGQTLRYQDGSVNAWVASSLLYNNGTNVSIFGTATPPTSIMGQLHIADDDTTPGFAGLRVEQTGAMPSTGVGYGIYVSKTGASATNIGGHLESSGATNNWGLEVMANGTASSNNNYGIQASASGGTTATSTAVGGHFSASGSTTNKAIWVDSGDAYIDTSLKIQGISAARVPYETTFTGPLTQASDINYTLPPAQGASSTYLQNNGSGNLSWASAGVGSVTYVDSGTGLTGGPITSVGTLELANTAVTPGTYEATWGSPTLVIPGFTVDQQGRLTNATTFTFTLPVLPSGTLGQTLRNDGSSWEANSLLYNDGTNVSIFGTATPPTSIMGQLHIADDDTTPGFAGLRVEQTGAMVGTGTGYGIYVSKTGASGTNYGGHLESSGATTNYGVQASAVGSTDTIAIGGAFSATGATTNWGLQVTSGNVFMGDGAAPATPQAGLDVFHNITASGGMARDEFLRSTLTASAKNDVLNALEIGTNFNDNGNAGVLHNGLLIDDPSARVGIGVGSLPQAALDLGTTVTPSGGVARGVYLRPVLTAGGPGDTLTGLEIAPSYGGPPSTRYDLVLGTGSVKFNGVPYTWPSIQGGGSTYLQNNGLGGLSWQTVSGGLPPGTLGQTLRHDGLNWVANSLLYNNGTNVAIYDGPLPSPIMGQLHIVDSDTTNNFAGLRVEQTGAMAGILQQGYGLYVTKTGASFANIGGYFNGSGATAANTGLQVFANGVDTSSNSGLQVSATGGNSTMGGSFSAGGAAINNTGVQASVSGVGTSINYGLNANAFNGNNATGGNFSAGGAANNNYGLYATSTGGGAPSTNYGVYSNATGVGTTNVGGYFSAAGATNNYGLVVPSGSVGIGTATPSSTLEVAGDIKVSGKTSYTPSAVNPIDAGTGIDSGMINKKVILVAGSGGPVDITASPPIDTATAIDGQMIILLGTDDTNTVKFNDGANLHLSANTSFTLGSGDILQCIYVAGLSSWIEISRTDN